MNTLDPNEYFHIKVCVLTLINPNTLYVVSAEAFMNSEKELPFSSKPSRSLCHHATLLSV